jgi:hypothetical protein
VRLFCLALFIPHLFGRGLQLFWETGRASRQKLERAGETETSRKSRDWQDFISGPHLTPVHEN